jgi:nitroreductase
MFTELAKKRRSPKAYTAQPIEQEKINAIVETALRAPSGRALRPWAFVVVDDKQLLEKLSVAKPKGAEFIKGVAAAIVVCADASQAPLWIEDCAIASVSIQYAACSLGLGSRWAQMRGNQFSDDKSSRDYIAELLGLPENLDVECIIGMGYPAEEIAPYTLEELHFDKVSYNRYGEKKS